MIDVTLSVDVELGDLVLAGRGFVGGRTVDRRGRPLAGVLVDAVAAEGATSGALADAPSVDRRDGRLRGCATSQGDGSFRIDGLAAGSYRFATYFERSTERGDTPVLPLGDTSAELIVERHRLRILVVDEESAPLPETECLFHVGARYETLARIATLRLEADGTVAVDARAGERVTVTATLAGCVPAEGEYTFGDDDENADEDAELRLVLRPIGDRIGALELTITDEQGVALAPATVTLRTPLGGMVENCYRRPLASVHRIEGLPAGRYQVEVFAGVPQAGPFPESSLWFPASVEAEVHADQTTAVSLRLRAGGRLRFTLRVPPDVATDASVGANLDHLPALLSPPPLGVVYRLHDDGTVELGEHDFLPGVAYLSAPLLEPGIHRLRFKGAGFRPLEQSFTIRAGEATDLELLLEPE